MKKIQNIIIASILSVGLIISVSLLANAMEKNNRTNNTITVRGEAEKIITSDEISLTVELVVFDPDKEKLEELLELKENELKESFKKLELSQTKILNDKVKTYYSLAEGKNKVKNYYLEKIFTIESSDYSEILRLIEEISRLNLDSKDYVVNKPNFVFKKNVEKEKNNLLDKANKDANNKAYLLVKKYKKELGEIKKITQGRFSVEDTEQANMKVLKVYLNATYEIN